MPEMTTETPRDAALLRYTALADAMYETCTRHGERPTPEIRKAVDAAWAEWVSYPVPAYETGTLFAPGT